MVRALGEFGFESLDLTAEDLSGEGQVAQLWRRTSWSPDKSGILPTWKASAAATHRSPILSRLIPCVADLLAIFSKG